MKKALLLFLAMGIATLSQAQFGFPKEIYLNPKMSNFSKTHKTIAILPVNVKFMYKTQQFDFDPEAERIAEMNTSAIVQSNLYSFILTKSSKMSVEVQDVETTNVLLKRAEVNDKITEFTKAELAKILGVDAVVSGMYEVERPVAELPRHRFPPKPPVDPAKPGTAVDDRPVYYAAFTMNINDGPSGTLLWRYYKKTGNFNTYDLSDDLISKMVKDLPYSK